MAAARNPPQETSPYFGVQKRGARYLAERRNVSYGNTKLDKFYHRTADELEAAFRSDAINYFASNKEACPYNFANGRTVLTKYGSQYRKVLDERLAKYCPMEKEYPDQVSNEYKSFLTHDVKELWDTHRDDIVKDHVRPLHQGSSKRPSRKIMQGERRIEKETEEVIPRNTDNQGLSVKFDVDEGLVLRAPGKERDLKKSVLLPPALEEHQGSHCGTQINRDEGIDGSSATSGENLDNMVPHIRCAEYENWSKVAAKFIAPYSQKTTMQFLLRDIAPMLKLCKALQYPSNQGGPEFAQMHIESQQGSQCALYEKIYDKVTEFVDSECRPEEIQRYHAESGPIIQRCRANWHY